MKVFTMALVLVLASSGAVAHAQKTAESAKASSPAPSEPLLDSAATSSARFPSRDAWSQLGRGCA